MADPAEIDIATVPSDNSSPPKVTSPSSSLPPVVSYVSTCEEMNPARRCSMEDCSVYAAAGTWGAPDPNMALLLVCDGHGGREMVEYLEEGLAYHVAQELRFCDEESKLDGKAKPTPMSTTLERAFMMADVHSKTLGVETSGATVALCLVQRTGETTWTVYAANAGDARIVLGYNNGEAFRLTKDHRTDDPEEVQRIENSGGFMFKGRVLGILAVTRSLGDHCMKEYVISKPFCQEKTVTKEHEDEPVFLILACDGLWDVMEDQDAVNFVMNHLDEKNSVAQHLVREALRRGSTDNITVQVAWL